MILYDTLISLLKEYIVYSSKLIKSSFYRTTAYSDIIKKLDTEGIVKIPSFIQLSDAKFYRELIDSYLNNDSEINIWRDSLLSDERIFFSNTLNDKFDSLHSNKFVKEILYSYQKQSFFVDMLLASRIRYVKNNMGSGGGWHRDSPHSSQLKAIYYLTDVDEGNGPFQYIVGSHTKNSLVEGILNKQQLPSQTRFSENQVLNYSTKQNLSLKTVTGKAVDLILVDTKGLHRGKPLLVGQRYALTSYFWRKTPKQFISFRQKD